tara:strand:+ start:52 stop:669 length:618 start_codon:yes stop_codon:yes gene_type:complete
MSQTIDLTQFPANEPSLCITYVFANIRRQRVWDAIKEANLGMIERIDMVQLTDKNGKPFQRVFIHFKHWFRNQTAQDTRRHVINGNTAKIIYDDPWFWKLVASKAKKPEKQPDRRPAKTRVELSIASPPSSTSVVTLGDFVKSPPTSPTSSMCSSPGGTRRFPYPGSHDYTPESPKHSKKNVPPPIKTNLEQPALPERKRAPASS